MKKTTLRFVTLALAITLCVLAQNPRAVAAAACPTLTCAELANELNEIGCGVNSIKGDGTCTEGGTTHNLLILHGACGQGGVCYQ